MKSQKDPVHLYLVSFTAQSSIRGSFGFTATPLSYSRGYLCYSATISNIPFHQLLCGTESTSIVVIKFNFSDGRVIMQKATVN